MGYAPGLVPAPSVAVYAGSGGYKSAHFTHGFGPALGVCAAPAFVVAAIALIAPVMRADTAPGAAEVPPGRDATADRYEISSKRPAKL